MEYLGHKARKVGLQPLRQDVTFCQYHNDNSATFFAEQGKHVLEDDSRLIFEICLWQVFLSRVMPTFKGPG